MKMPPAIPALAAAVGFLAASSSAFAALVVVNGNFEDTTGLTSLGGGWYSGVSAGWNGPGQDYSVGTGEGGNLLSNLEHSGPSIPSFTPLYQDIGALDSDATITMTFDISTPWNANPFQAGAAIWSAATFPVDEFTAATNITAAGTYTLTAENVPAGTEIIIGFWRGTSGSPGLDNVTISVAPVPEPEVWTMTAFGIGLCAVFLRLRRRGSSSLEAKS